jgi:hypothetical protein
MALFSARRLLRSGVIQLNAPPAVVFPLFTPAGERLWVPGWEPAYLSPASGETQLDMVFRTQHHEYGDAIWSLIARDPERHQVSYLRVAPASHVARVDVSCAEAPQGAAEATVSYTFTGLTEAGNAAIAAYSEPFYAAWLQGWAVAINAALAAGAVAAARGPLPEP